MQSLAVFLLAVVAVASASPIMFLTFEEDDGKSRILECVSPIGYEEDSKVSYKCRVRSKTHIELKDEKTKDIPVIEILKESLKEDNGVTALEISEEIFEVPSFNENQKAKYEIVEEPRKKKNQGGCADDEVFVGELDLCMPYAPHKVEPKVATIDEDDEAIVINPEHTILNVGYKKLKCPPGHIEIKDLGICAPINNCWPKPDCSHLEEKKDEKSTKVEDDD